MKNLIGIILILLLFSCQQNEEVSPGALTQANPISPIANVINGTWEHSEIWFNIESYQYEATIDTWEFTDSTLTIKSDQYQNYYNGQADNHSFHTMTYKLSIGVLSTSNNGYPIFNVPISVKGLNNMELEFKSDKKYKLTKI